jgi:hypothetical protein
MSGAVSTPMPRRGVVRMRPELSKPPAVPDTLTPGDQLLAAGLGVGAAAGGLVWAAGQLAGLAFGHTWLHLDPAQVAGVLWSLPHHLGDPALAWPASARRPPRPRPTRTTVGRKRRPPPPTTGSAEPHRRWLSHAIQEDTASRARSTLALWAPSLSSRGASAPLRRRKARPP